MKILSIDGGGIRGIIPAMILAEIEKRTNRAIWQMFDLIVGTSTGGMLAKRASCASRQRVGSILFDRPIN
ncbi:MULTISPECIES: patatin-like phospholipase family protein [unclassified Microcoleus]|uniref:patatin-like phospholipase family protein n=1 Tax=unclassified Microcoleus TaxID=2642155 RepID=UPI0025E4DB1C|nr:MULTISPECIES: patatin-like phospholipase family protein [unclassified Microcoleus]